MNKMYSDKRYIFVFLLPALILFCGVLIAPIGASAYYSFFDWNGFTEKTFIGLSNYKELFTSDSIGFMKALGNSLLLAVLSVFLQLPLPNPQSPIPNPQSPIPNPHNIII